jgi:CheY-like chemotaxis protein
VGDLRFRGIVAQSLRLSWKFDRLLQEPMSQGSEKERSAPAPPQPPADGKPADGKKVLFVEDDSIIARVYTQKLADEGFQVTLAKDGIDAMRQLPVLKPDLVVLDLMMPRMTGADVLKFIRSHPDLKSTHVIVFSNSFLSNLVEQVASLGVDVALVKSAITPARLAREIRNIVEGPPYDALPHWQAYGISGQTAKSAQPGPPPAKSTPAPAPAGQAPAPKSEPSASAAPSAPEPPAHGRESDSDFLTRMNQQFLDRTPGIFRELRKLCREFLESKEPAALSSSLAALNQKLGFLTQISAMAGYPRTAELSSALEALLFELSVKPTLLTDSSRQTIASSIALMARSFDNPPPARERDRLHTSILVVDDDAISNRAVVEALGRAKLPVTSVGDPVEALKMLRQTTFNLVLMDILMPGMDGTAVCEQMRGLPANKSTPVIFITSHTDFPTRARSILSGGDDLITKPISPTELCVKALAHLLKPA